MLADCTGFITNLTSAWSSADTSLPADLSGLNLAVDEYVYLAVKDGVNREVIRVENVAGTLEITREQCNTVAVDFPTDACLTCVEVCEAEEEGCVTVRSINTTTLDHSIGEDCNVTLDIPSDLLDAINAEWDVCEESEIADALFVTDNFLIERNCNMFRLSLNDLCEALSECLSTDGGAFPEIPVCHIQSDTLEVSQSGVNNCTYNVECNPTGVTPGDYNGLVVDDCGRITSLTPTFGQFVTQSDLDAATTALSVGVESITVATPLLDTGTATNPSISLQTIHGASGECNGVMYDTYGRVTGCVPGYNQFNRVDTNDPCLTVTDNGSGIFYVDHVNNLGGPQSFNGTGALEGLEIDFDQCGHITDVSYVEPVPTTQQVTACIDLATGTVTGTVGAVTASIAGSDTVVAWGTSFSSNDYWFSAVDQLGNPVPATTRTATGATWPTSASVVYVAAAGNI